jgi:predicted enzyme related to lactoylglutathione lyase
MEAVTGIGGVFFKAKDKMQLLEWYRDFLGIAVQDWGGTAFIWAGEGQPNSRPGQTIWSIFPEQTSYFGSGGQSFMLNFRVRDLNAMLVELKQKGANVDPKTEISEFGAFGWVTDPEGNRVELWQPPDQPMP